MRVPFRQIPLFAALLAAVAFTVWIQLGRLERVTAVTAAGDEAPAVDPTSPTGYRGGVRQLILPTHDYDSYQWIAQTQQAIRQGVWRLRHVDYDNAPFGRPVLAPSPYRWWLTAVATVDQSLTDRSPPRAVEQAALWSDAVLEVLFLVVAGLLVARWISPVAATVQTLALATAIPLANIFLGGAATDRGLGLIAIWGALLPLLIGIRQCQRLSALDERASNRWFVAGGLLGGVALWLSPANAMLAAVGVAAGALRLALRTRATRKPVVAPRVWLAWGTSAGGSVLVCTLIEHFPDAMAGWHLEQIHPLWGLAWVGLGALLAWTATVIETGRPPAGRWWIAVVVAALIALALPIFLLVRHGDPLGLITPLSLHPPLLAGGRSAESLWDWLARDGISFTAIAAILPLLVLPIVGWLGARKMSGGFPLAATWMAGPVLVVAVAAATHLFWWGLLDLVLILWLVVTLAAPPADATAPSNGEPAPAERTSVNGKKWGWIALCLAAFGPAAWALTDHVAGSAALTESDVIALVERDAAHWLANRAGPHGAVVVAPPGLSTAMYFHGGLRVVGTPYWENKAGTEAAIRMVGASSPDEGLALAQRREVNFIVLPSWDSVLDEFVRVSSSQPDKTLIGQLHQWYAPRWLRPVPYPMPAIPGFEKRSIAVFEVTEVQDNALALSRLAEYFVEMQRLDDAASVAMTLEHTFPSDLGAWVARAAVANAFGDPDRIREDMQMLTRPQSLTSADALPWDRQVSYAIALAQAQRLDLARVQLERCLARIDEPKLRFLTLQSLYRFQLLCKVCRLELPAPLRAVGRQLLPPDLREKI